MVWLIAAVGLIILLVAGDLLVRGAVNASLRFGLPALIVSLTVVAFGTSAPELLISIQAVLEGAQGLAIGNAVGSNTANVLLVLGVPALVATLRTAEFDTRKSYVSMVGASFMFILLCFLGPLTFVHGLILLIMLGLIIADQVRAAIVHKRTAEPVDVEGAEPDSPLWKIILYISLGIIGLPLGAGLFVDAAIELAQMFGVSDGAIGLTLVALGTSLPELATTAVAAYRRQADVALGNVIGSNLFNILAIVGIATMFGPIAVPREFLTFDLWVMIGASLLLLPFVFTDTLNLTRRWGLLLTVLYVVYVVLVVRHG
ncbi:MAG: calcium/sodium antiporter [Boseongicola sp.]|nr:calcium/sodium antiporter [Boseongicola sp.]MDD9979491.1 calcium/sodium antiporter [Boseongicola sp.]